MTTAQKILVVAGSLAVLYGMGLGIPLANVRGRQPAAPRALVNAHLAGLIQGAVLLGLAVAAGLADLTAWLVTLAAALVAGGAVLETLGGTLNWRQGVSDQFAQRSLGWRLNSASAPASLLGTAILALGALLGL